MIVDIRIIYNSIMYKIFKQELANPNNNEKTIEKIRQYLNEGFEYKIPTSKQAFLMRNSTFFIVVTCLSGFLAITGLIMALPLLWVPMIIIAIILGITSIPGYSLKKKYIHVSESQLQPKQHNIYKIWFEDLYEDIDVEELSNTSLLLKIAKANRGEGIPNDARAEEIRDGYTLVGKNGAHIQAITTLWHWTRTTGSGKNRRTQHYYVRKCYILTNGVKDSYKDFWFTLKRNNLFRKGKDKLENTAFNKKFVVNSNDPVKLRMLLTPSVQEEAIKFIIYDGYEINKMNEGIFTSFTIPRSDSTFIINMKNFKDFHDKDAVINAFLYDVVNDIVAYQEWISSISVFRTLFETI